MIKVGQDKDMLLFSRVKQKCIERTKKRNQKFNVFAWCFHPICYIAAKHFINCWVEIKE